MRAIYFDFVAKIRLFQEKQHKIITPYVLFMFFLLSIRMQWQIKQQTGFST